MTTYLLIGVIWINGQLTADIHHEYRTAKACTAELRRQGLKDRGDGYWEGGRNGLFVRAACIGPDVKLVEGTPS